MDKNEGFEQWYVENVFDLSASPIGGRDCALQRKGYQAGVSSCQPEIDALKLDQKICRSLYGNASREIERLREEGAALKAEKLHLRTTLDEAFKISDRLIAEINALKAEVEGLRADAELNRQRYLHEVYRSELRR